MDELGQLNDLQGVDLRLQSAGQDLSDVRSGLADQGDLPKIKGQLERVEAALADRSERRRSAEMEVERVTGVSDDLERRLYDGSVTNQREFDALRDQRDFAAAEKEQAEDGLLELMVELEDLEGSRERHVQVIERLTRDRAAEVSELQSRESELTAVIDELERERQAMASELPPALLGRYESLRKTRGGQAVAGLDGRVCGVCRVELPIGDLARARAGQEIVQCNSCRRIIFTG